jgi:hypothetical protein
VKTYRTSLAVLAALLVAGPLTLAPARAQSQNPRCSSEKAAEVNSAPLQLPPDAKHTHDDATFDVDLGSDNRVRDVRVVESSGDKVTDALIRATIERSNYRTTTNGCVATSNVVRVGYRLTDKPAPQPTPPGPPPPDNPSCTPLVVPFISPGRRDPSKHGTAIVAIPLDAAASRQGEPRLTQRTGSAALDEEALRIASSAQFRFMDSEGCSPQPFSYFLELTFN